MPEQSPPIRQHDGAALFEAAPFAVFGLVVEDGSIASLNPAFERLTGWRSNDWLGRSITDLTHPDDVPAVIAQIHFVTLGERTSSFEARWLTSEGGFVAVELTLARERLSEGSEQIIGFAQDISLRRAVVRDLRAAKEAAESASRAKSEFLANISHELRTPLNAILGMSDLLTGTPLAERQQRFTETIRKSSRTLLTLVNELLDFSKIESGRLELELHPFRLRECVESAAELVAASAAAKGLRLTVLVGESCPSALLGDVTRLRQVLANLLSNAVKFTERGKVGVEVEADAETDSRGHHTVRFAVHDTGIGIPPEHHERIFDAFSQAEASTVRQFGGTGLGLAISQRLARLMGGRIELESRIGQGSTFRFSIRAHAADPDEAADSGELGADPELALKLPLRILVVDDQETNRDVAVLLLETMGYDADVAEGGQEALEILAETSYDIVLMDMRMPDLDGFETTRRLRLEVPDNEQPQVIAMTANATQDDRTACLAADMDDFLSKPILVPFLQNALIQAAGRHGLGVSVGGESSTEPVDSDDDEQVGSAQEAALRALNVSTEIPVLDSTTLDIVRRHRPDRLSDLVSAFLENNVRRIRDARQAIEDGEAEALRLAAHSLKGTCANIGALRLAAIAELVEDIARAGSTHGAASLVAEFERHEAELREILNASS